MGKRPAGLTLLDLYPSFPCLVWEMIRADHTTTILYAARKTRIDHGTLRKWLYARTKTPPAHLVQQYAAAYRLPFDEVMAVVTRDSVRQVRREPIPLPDLSNVRRGPQPDPHSKRSRRRLRLTRPIGGGSVGPPIPHVVEVLDKMSLIRLRCYRLLTAWAQPLLPTWSPVGAAA